ncbi:hypothetical protein AA103196_2493 [Ameyamaea chiangmaiensis NBRC 103196]|nr:hypothetical protein AA103196_2493 [Ameyamaea chiangmaiensis NBRC 103196]
MIVGQHNRGPRHAKRLRQPARGAEALSGHELSLQDAFAHRAADLAFQIAGGAVKLDPGDGGVAHKGIKLDWPDLHKWTFRQDRMTTMLCG